MTRFPPFVRLLAASVLVASAACGDDDGSGGGGGGGTGGGAGGGGGCDASVCGACADDNGGCDPLVSCILVAEAPVCGACPAEYTGNGTSGCVCALAADELEGDGGDEPTPLVFGGEPIAFENRSLNGGDVDSFSFSWPAGCMIDLDLTRTGAESVDATWHLVVLDGDAGVEVTPGVPFFQHLEYAPPTGAPADYDARLDLVGGADSCIVYSMTIEMLCPG